MRKRYVLALPVLLVLLSVIGIGCGSSDSETIADVGGYKITIAEFNDLYQASYPFVSAQDEFDKKREVLDSMIVTRLLVQGAYEKGIDKSPELARAIAAYKDKLLINVLAQRVVVDKAKPSEADLKNYWDKLEYKVRASHILVKDLDTANALLDRIKNGESFEKLAFEYSTDPSAKKNKGDLGYFEWGSMVDEFQNAVWAMEPGQVSPPVKTDFGYHIIKLVDRLPNEYRKDFKTMKADIKQRLTRQMQQKLKKEYIKKLQEKYPIRIDTTTCDYLIHKREALYPPALLQSLPKNDFDINALDHNERELVLATWNGGQVTVAEYLKMIKDLSPNFKPSLDAYDSLAYVIFNLKLNDILIVEAHSMGIDNDPEYLRKLKLFKELTMADIMRNDSLPMPPAPTEDELRQYYDEHKEEFTNPAKVHVYEILLSDELKARKLAKEIKSLKEFKERAMDLTERPGRRAEKGDLGYIERKWFPEIYDLAVKTPVGSIGGPVVTNGKYSIFYVEDITQAELKDYLGVKREIVAKLNQKRKAEAMQAWVKERMASTPIKIYEDVLWKTIDKDKYASQNETKGGQNN